MRKCFHGMTLSWEMATYENTSFILFIDDRFTVSMKTMLWVVGLTAFVVIGGTVGCRNGNLRCHHEDLKIQVLGRNRIGIDCKVLAIIFQYQSVDISLISDYER